MIYEFPSNFNKLDEITQDVILEDYADSLRDEGCKEEDIKMYVEIARYELID